MSDTTTNFGFVIYNAAGDKLTTNFLSFRQFLAGDEGSSALQIIDEELFARAKKFESIDAIFLSGQTSLIVANALIFSTSTLIIEIDNADTQFLESSLYINDGDVVDGQVTIKTDFAPTNDVNIKILISN